MYTRTMLWHWNYVMTHEPCYGYDKIESLFRTTSRGSYLWMCTEQDNVPGACFKVIYKVDGGRTYVIGRVPEDPLLFTTQAKSFGSGISRKLQYICHESVCDSEGRGHWRIGFCYDDVMTCKRFSDNWPFVRGIDRWAFDHPHKGLITRKSTFSLLIKWRSCSTYNEVVITNVYTHSWLSRVLMLIKSEILT